MKKPLIAVIILAAAGAGGYYVYADRSPAEEAPYLTLYGNVDIRDVALGFRVSGRIDSLRFEEGDTVERGTVLATLDREPFDEELVLRRAELAEGRAALAHAEKLYARRQNLVETGAVSRGAYDDALAARDEAAARVQTALARIELAETRLQDTEIRAPEDGVILTRVREPGSIVAEGAAVYSLALHDPVWVRTYVDEPSLGLVQPGQRATVRTDTGDTFTGQVGYISPQAEFTPKNVETTQLRTDLVYRLRVIVEDAQRGLRQGMPVTVTLDKREVIRQ